MSTKRRTPDRPVCFFGKVVFEFFNNDDEDFKNRSLRELVKDARKELNVSCVIVETHEVANPERGTLILTLGAASHEQGKALLDKALAFFDGKAPARILLDEFQEAEVE